MDIAFLAVGGSLVLIKLVRDGLNLLVDYYIEHR